MSPAVVYSLRKMLKFQGVDGEGPLSLFGRVELHDRSSCNSNHAGEHIFISIKVCAVKRIFPDEVGCPRSRPMCVTSMYRSKAVINNSHQSIAASTIDFNVLAPCAASSAFVLPVSMPSVLYVVR